MGRFATPDVPSKLPAPLNTGIYQIRNAINGRAYIGSALRVGKRWREHLRGLRSGKHHSRFMQRCWDKHGESVFEFSLLIACASKDLLFYEQRCIDALKPKYNSSPTAGSQLGLKMRPESKARLSEAAKRTRNFTGHRHTDETRARISASRTGKGGGPRSAERCARISAALTGKRIPQEVRDRIAATLKGHKQSPEQIDRRLKSMPPGHYERVAIAKSKLSDDDVRVVRRRLASGEMQAAIARDFRVSQGVISRISLGVSYNWVSQ